MRFFKVFGMVALLAFDFSLAGTIKDSRDNHVYKTVVIGTQEWMAENLNFKVNDKKQTWCFENKESNCKKYGRLYTWSAAMAKPEAKCGHGNLCAGIEYPHRGICPEGFYLPSEKDWRKLMKYIKANESQVCECEYEDCYDEEEQCYTSFSKAGYILKSREFYGSDAVGFNALLSGFGFDFTSFDYLNVSALYWSSNEDDGLDAYRMCFLDDKDDGNWSTNSKLNALAVRCVRNAENFVAEVRNEDELRATAEKNAPALRKIYNEYRQYDSSLKGKVSLTISVNEAGDVYDISVAFTNIDDVEFVNAIVDAVWEWKFGVAETGNASVTVPFAFF